MSYSVDRGAMEVSGIGILPCMRIKGMIRTTTDALCIRSGTHRVFGNEGYQMKANDLTPGQALVRKYGD